MSLTPKDHQIIAQSAAHDAATIVAAAIQGGQLAYEDAHAHFDAWRDHVRKSTLRIIEEATGSVEEQAVANVVQAFPGTTDVSGPAPAVPAAGPAPAPGPAPFPGPVAETKGSKEEALWQHLFANPDDWWDNRQDKANGRSPNGPDFKRKSDKAGLWIHGRYGSAPDWVLQRLGVK